MVRLNKFIQLIVVIIGAGFFNAAFSQDEISGYRQTLNQYCVSCHNEALKTADLMLDMANLQDLSKDPALWEKVLLKLQTRSMPPVGMPRPDENFYN
ncbi:MAG: hypothetical protein ACKVHQ_14010, partial [Gammaproteobacteria bacterium]